MPEITLVLNNIRSTHNVGSIFRTAEGFGVKEVILAGYTPYPAFKGDSRLPHLAEKITKQIHKTALGAESMVAFDRYENLEEWLANTHLPLVALEQSTHSVDIRTFAPPKKFALLLGEEVDGIAEDTLKKCKAILEIPMAGKKESFNVSVATGIALYALTAA